MITTGMQLSDEATDSARDGPRRRARRLSPGHDRRRHQQLADPLLVPRKAMQIVMPRPGVPAEVDIALVGGGDVEGALVKSGGGGFEGLDLELVDSSGKVVATTRSDFDGFFLFERVAYGRYTIRLDQASAEAARSSPDLDRSLEVTPEKPVVRLGAIPVSPLKRIAQNLETQPPQ